MNVITKKTIDELELMGEVSSVGTPTKIDSQWSIFTSFFLACVMLFNFCRECERIGGYCKVCQGEGSMYPNNIKQGDKI